MGRAAEAGRVVGPPAEPGAHLRADVIRPRGLPCSSPDRNPPRRHRLTPPPESASAPSSPRLASLSPAARSAMPPECAPRPSAPPSTNSSRPASRQPPAGTTDASPMDPRGARRRNAARLPGMFRRFFHSKMKYHVEDHMFPMVPCHRESVLHERIRQDLPGPDASNGPVHAESRPWLRRRLRHDDVFLRRVLPATVQPCGEDFHAQASEAQASEAQAAWAVPTGGDRFRVPTAEGRRVSAAGLLLLAACSGGRWLARPPPRRESAGGASNRWAGPESVPGGGLGQRTFGRPRFAPARNIGTPDPGAVPGHAG